MDAKRAFVHAGKYFALTALLSLVGFALLAGGFVYAGMQAGSQPIMGVAVPIPGTASLPGFLVSLVGLAIWRFGKAWAFFKTLPAAIEEDVGETFDTEHVKSDIVSILDDRLNDMQQDLQSVNRELRELKDEEEGEQFAFDN
jgi:hypothetical protein